MFPTIRRLLRSAFLLIVGAQLSLFAAAKLVSSVPSADSRVDGGTVEISLRFDTEVDALKSTVDLEGPNGAVQHLTRQPATAPANLDFIARGLVRGAYQIRWKAVDSAGEESNGLILFRVK